MKIIVQNKQKKQGKQVKLKENNLNKNIKDNLNPKIIKIKAK